MANYPVGKAQKMVLDALDLTAKDHSDAKRIFAELGIEVTSRREGRKSVPVVTEKTNRLAGGWNPGGDGADGISRESVDLSAVEQWMEN